MTPEHVRVTSASSDGPDGGNSRIGMFGNAATGVRKPDRTKEPTAIERAKRAFNLKSMGNSEPVKSTVRIAQGQLDYLR